MAEPDWPLCLIDADDDNALREAYRAIYINEYVRADVRDWAGRRIRFHPPSFEHAFSASGDYRLSAGVHDIALSLPRLQRIRWIGLALGGEGIRIEVLAQNRQDSRGRWKKRRTVIVLDNRYVVVLQPHEGGGFDYEFVTAFPADRSYLDRIRRGAQVVERRAQK